MSLNYDLVGVEGHGRRAVLDLDRRPALRARRRRGPGDPLAELEFTTENSIGVQAKVLPTFGDMHRRRRGPAASATSTRAARARRAGLHAAPAAARSAGTSRSVSQVAGIYDKGSGALVVDRVDAPWTPPPASRWSPPAGRSSSAARAASAATAGRRRPGRCRPGRPTPRSPTPTRPRAGAAVPADRATATRCTPTRSSPPGAASTGRSCTACAPTATPGGRCCTRSAGRDPARFRVDGGPVHAAGHAR